MRSRTRTNINDYYPAINAAYLYKMQGGREEGKGTKLAQFIISSWEEHKGKEFWLDSTLAECEMLIGDYDEAADGMKTAIALHKPGEFEKKSVLQQIKLYATLCVKQTECEQILLTIGGPHA